MADAIMSECSGWRVGCAWPPNGCVVDHGKKLPESLRTTRSSSRNGVPSLRAPCRPELPRRPPRCVPSHNYISTIYPMMGVTARVAPAMRSPGPVRRVESQPQRSVGALPVFFWPFIGSVPPVIRPTFHASTRMSLHAILEVEIGEQRWRGAGGD